MSRRSRRARARDRQRGGTALTGPVRAVSMVGPGGYVGARADRRALLEWNPRAQSADADIIGDLTTLRARSRDLARNTPIAGGAIETVVTSAVGKGLRPQPRIDADYLEIEDEAADEYERQIGRLVRYVLTSSENQLDVAGLLGFPEQQQHVVRSTLESGDVFNVRRHKPRLGLPIGLSWQLIEADRVSNPLAKLERPGFLGGIEQDEDGAHIAYHISSHYPDEFFGLFRQDQKWTRIPATGKAGRMVLHHAWRRRPNQTRGVPYLAAVIEPLKQLATYGDAELMAAVIGSLFTVFIKSEYDGETGPLGAGTSGGFGPDGKSLPPNYRLGGGAILQLLQGESVEIANPGRPNAAYDPFVLAKIKEIGVALGLPFEVLIKSFQASFSASRASQLEAWRFYYLVRDWLARGFCQPTYEGIVTECVALGLLDLPGFFEDPLARHAWLGCTWVGDAPGELDPVAAVDAAVKRVNAGMSTLERETPMLTGEDWETTHRQRAKERRMRRTDGLEEVTSAVPSAEPVSSPTPANPDERDEAEDREREEGERAA